MKIGCSFRRKGRLAAALFTLAALAAACGDSDSNQDAADAPADSLQNADTTASISLGLPKPQNPDRQLTEVGPQAEGEVVRVTLTEEGFDLDRKTVPPGQVTLDITNSDAVRHIVELHNQYVGRWRSTPIPPGGRVQLSMVLAKAPYELWLPDAGDKESAPTATLVVR